MDEAQRLLAGDPSTLKLLTPENIPTQYKVVPTDATDVNTLRQLRDSLGDLPERVEDRPRRPAARRHLAS